MENSFTTPITYYLQEGRENLRETLSIAFRSAKVHNIGKIVIFTAKGAGVRLAIEDFLSQPDYKHIQLVAVTFPKGKRFTGENNQPIAVEIPQDDEKLFAERRISVIRAHLPFDPITPPFRNRGVLGQDLSLIGDALSMFGGSMSLCVQATILACDAGAVNLGEHVIALTSDTAILVQATSTIRMLSEFTIREILCKPAILSVGRRESAEKVISGEETTKPRSLGEEQDEKSLPAKKDSLENT